MTCLTPCPGNPPIVLLTDFGHQDAFVGILKGVILTINPVGAIVDLSHGVRPQDLFHGAFLLASAMGYFPGGTIFCVVVDPGVGSERRPVLIQTRDYYFVGPDNGVLWPAAQKNQVKHALHLNQPAYFLKTISSTFHGRDIFAPIAAHLSQGVSINKLGTPVNNLVSLEFPGPEKQGNHLILTVLDIDIYGNITLNIGWDEFKSFAGNRFCLEAGTIQISRFHKIYAQAQDLEPFLVVGSSGYMEISVKNGSAAGQLKINCRDRLILSQ